jgi:hypothetical protein
MDENGSPTSPAPEATESTTTPSYESSNDLDFEMSPEQEQDFVNKTLGITDPSVEAPKDDNPTNAPKPDGTGEEPETPPTPKEPQVTPPEQPAPAAVKPPEAPEPVVAPVEQAGVDTSDLWIEVENADGTPVKITLDGGLPEDFQFKSDKQLYEVMESMQEMKNLQAEREADFEAKNEQQLAQQSQDAQLTTWESETQTLIDAGLIPEPKLKSPANGKQFTPEEVEADPSLKLQNEVYTFMKSENDKRIGEGKPPIMSFGTMFNVYQQQQKNDAEAKAKEEEAKLTKERGALIGGTSAASGGEKSAYVAGSHANIWSVPVET